MKPQNTIEDDETLKETKADKLKSQKTIQTQGQDSNPKRNSLKAP